MPKLARLSQRGDTIVEVLICMAVIGFALSVCYGIAHRSLFIIRQSEEHGQSLQLAQGQLERFRDYLRLNPLASTDSTATAPNIFILDSSHYGFCVLNDSSGKLVLQKVIDDPKDPLCSINEAGVYYCEANDCSVAPSRSTVDGAGYFYRAGIAYCHTACTGGTPDQFYALAGRYSAESTPNTEAFDVVSLQYRIHQ